MTTNEVHRALAGRSRVRTLEALRVRTEPMSVNEITESVGLHPNTVRFHLQQLIGAGLVSQQADPRPQRGRPRVLYSATPRDQQLADDTGIYRAMAEALAVQLEQDAPDPAAAATEAGRTWGRDIARRRPAPAAGAPAARSALTTVLDELGFEPHPRPAPRFAGTGTEVDTEIGLHHCPLLEVARRHPAVTCGLHLGLMQGLLLETGDHVRATGLRPFVSPGVCIAHVEDRAAAPPTIQH